MSRIFSPVTVWTQVPVASRTVEVNTKTGFSLTAGSYSVRASDIQRGTISLSAVASATATITSVTTTRAITIFGGWINNEATAYGTIAISENECRVLLTNATTVTAARNTSSAANPVAGFQVQELY